MNRLSFGRGLLIAAVPLTLLAFGCQEPQRATGRRTGPSATARQRRGAGTEVNGIVDAARKLGTETANPVVTTDSGLKYIQVKQGKGEAAKAGDMAVVHYTGWLVDGKKFDSSVDRGTPFSFLIGEGRVIEGWDEGVAGMKPGEVRKLIVPPDLGYGDRHMGPIPPNSTLIFDVELREVQKVGQP